MSFEYKKGKEIDLAFLNHTHNNINYTNITSVILDYAAGNKCSCGKVTYFENDCNICLGCKKVYCIECYQNIFDKRINEYILSPFVRVPRTDRRRRFIRDRGYYSYDSLTGYRDNEVGIGPDPVRLRMMRREMRPRVRHRIDENGERYIRLKKMILGNTCKICMNGYCEDCFQITDDMFNKMLERNMEPPFFYFEICTYCEEKKYKKN